jgi:hypothetical protein
MHKVFLFIVYDAFNHFIYIIHAQYYQVDRVLLFHS